MCRRWFGWCVLWFGVFAVHLEAADPIVLRVLSYNIHHGEGVDGVLDLDRIAAVIASVRPDIVALQEVDQNVARSETIDQAGYLSRKTGLEFLFGANIDLQGGHYGNAVLSRFPISVQTNHRLPNMENGEQRGALQVGIDIPGRTDPITLFATHFDHRRKDTERIASAERINQLVGQQSDAPALLVGDLNAVIGSRPLDELGKQWTVANAAPLPTVPVSQPERQIDFVLFSPQAAWQTVEVRVLDENVASDHRPILAVLRLVR